MKRIKMKKEALFIIGAIVLIVIARFAIKESKIKPVESKYLILLQWDMKNIPLKEVKN